MDFHGRRAKIKGNDKDSRIDHGSPLEFSERKGDEGLHVADVFCGVELFGRGGA